jgi:hypothetical protein
MNSLDDLGEMLGSTQSIHSSSTIYDDLQQCKLECELEKLARFLAEAWRDEHLDEWSNVSDCSELYLNQCIAYVTAEMAEAATLVGGSVGLEILTGAGSAAARAVCQQVLSKSHR